MARSEDHANNDVILTLFYGAHALHVGFIYKRDHPEAAELKMRDSINKAVSEQFGKDVQLKEHDGVRESWFPRATTYAVPLKEHGIEDLADFEHSPQKAILEALIEVIRSWPK